MTSQGLTNVLWSYATLRYFPRELLVAIAQELYERLPTLHVQVGHPPDLLTHPVDRRTGGAPVCVQLFSHDGWATLLIRHCLPHSQVLQCSHHAGAASVHSGAGRADGQALNLLYHMQSPSLLHVTLP